MWYIIVLCAIAQYNFLATYYESMMQVELLLSMYCVSEIYFVVNTEAHASILKYAEYSSTN